MSKWEGSFNKDIGFEKQSNFFLLQLTYVKNSRRVWNKYVANCYFFFCKVHCSTKIKWKSILVPFSFFIVKYPVLKHHNWQLSITEISNRNLMQSWVKANHLSKFKCVWWRFFYLHYYYVLFFFSTSNFFVKLHCLLLMVNAIVREEEEEKAMESSHVAFI